MALVINKKSDFSTRDFFVPLATHNTYASRVDLCHATGVNRPKSLLGPLFFGDFAAGQQLAARDWQAESFSIILVVLVLTEYCPGTGWS